mmetsp:Transcript_38663/g.70380  ORF Transcript_38663/g.70380 Transcript_38663/m.70380 type:complete len:657 (+) Transcript_38663:85-2055(+)
MPPPTDEEDKLSQPPSHGQFARFLTFYENLGEKQRWQFARITEQIPVDSFAGLIRVNQLYNEFTLVRFVLLFGRMLLNLYTVANNFFLVFGDGDSSRPRSISDQGQTDGECDNHAQLEGECITFSDMEGFFIQIVVGTEFSIVVSLTLLTLIFFGIFLAGLKESLPEKCPMIFFFMGQGVSKMSSMSFLQYINGDRQNAALWRGDTKVEFVMAQDALAGFLGVDDFAERTMEHMRSSRTTALGLEYNGDTCVTKPWVWRVAATLFFGIFICVSVLGLRVKMMFAHFAIKRAPWEWSIREMLLFSGFLGQLAGICDVNHIEVMRVLCFKFGGADSYWNWQDCAVCNEYFRLLAVRITTGKIGKGKKKDEKFLVRRMRGRLRALAVMSTLYSDDIQTQILSRPREMKIRSLTSRRNEILNDAFMGHGSKQFQEGIRQYKEKKAQWGRTRAAAEFEGSAEWQSWVMELRRIVDDLTTPTEGPTEGAAKSRYGDLCLAVEIQELLEDFRDYQDLLRCKTEGGTKDLAHCLGEVLEQFSHLMPHSLPSIPSVSHVDTRAAERPTERPSWKEITERKVLGGEKPVLAHGHGRMLESIVSILEHCAHKIESVKEWVGLDEDEEKEALPGTVPESQPPVLATIHSDLGQASQQMARTEEPMFLD